MTVKNLEKKNEVDLLKELKEKREDLRHFRFGLSGSKTRDIKDGKNIRRDIARIETELNSRKEK
ncbi:50S ribosomal protein L29 [Candidatus Nomurabacteria bacterium]|nr:50S ribosomal protein L29 [Candidatus Nomurabacteria bacterium]